MGGRGPAKICEPPEAILQFLKEEGDRLFDTNPHEFVRVPKEDGRYKVSERVRLGISKVDTFVAERSATGNEATD
jgi:hypothetical protein